MTPELVGGVGVLALLILILARVPVAIAMGLVAFCGYIAIDGWTRATLVLGALPQELTNGYSLSVVPLFVLMGEFANASGLSRDLYRSANLLFRGYRGSLSLATVGACAGFGAVCGSSLATAATMGRVAIPQMREAGYAPGLASGTVAAGGTLGILIPPSVILLIYAAIARESVPQLFAAAIIPGVLLTVFYALVVMVLIATVKGIVPKEGAAERWQGWRELSALWEVAILFGGSVGGIYLGWFSPTEAAAVGAFLALLLGVLRRRLDRAKILASIRNATQTTAMLFFIILATFMFSFFVVQTRLPLAFAGWVTDLNLGPFGVILILTLFYIVMGCFLDGIGIILITTPLFAPLVLASGFDMIWFGIYLVLIVELGLITPPVGMNLYVIAEQMPDVSMRVVFTGVLPFIAAQLALIGLIAVFPELVSWLPGLLY
ncbi:TRAP transporter large permease [Breoghania sp. L-A4]|uniref:TRAP transporter large permease n=1 Tax=Breoghania sp. L-A4 TaxID=2304600 RepID=UPI000E35CCD8|nr:TRAP transporter large permease [Breoghania sp. L-A4]AXS42171.1 TRAP transporter large permease [Breoghania sp. L-A4]